jgi:hypothetical protein
MVSSACGMSTHARIGLLALMVADESGRVHFYLFVQSFTAQYGAHNLFSRA